MTCDSSARFTTGIDAEEFKEPGWKGSGLEISTELVPLAGSSRRREMTMEMNRPSGLGRLPHPVAQISLKTKGLGAFPKSCRMVLSGGCFDPVPKGPAR